MDSEVVNKIAKSRVAQQSKQYKNLQNELSECKQSIKFASEIIFDNKLIENKSVEQIYTILIEIGKQRYKHIENGQPSIPYKSIRVMYEERAIYLHIYKALLKELQKFNGMSDKELKLYEKQLLDKHKLEYKQIQRKLQKEKNKIRRQQMREEIENGNV